MDSPFHSEFTLGMGVWTTVTTQVAVTQAAAVTASGEDIAAGRGTRYNSDEEFLAALEADLKPLSE